MSIGLIGGLGVGVAVHFYVQLAKAHAARVHLDAIVEWALGAF